MANRLKMGEAMLNLPDFLKQGEQARLIPIAPDKEAGVTSIVLSMIQTVPPFAGILMSSIGQRLGVRSKIECFTEVVFKRSPSSSEIRPDGLLIIKVGNRSWKAIIEAKIGKQQIEEKQIANYCQLAKQNEIDTVITISNQFAALPTHHPLKLNKKITGSVNVYHWSWMYIMTQAQLTLVSDDLKITEQRYLLEEMIKFLKNESVPTYSFDQMNAEWKDLVLMIQKDATLKKTSPEVQNSVAAWHQEQKDICLLLSRILSRHVTLRLSRKHLENQEQRLLDDSQELVENNTLRCTLEIPDAASSLSIVVDVGRRNISCEMRVTAPKDKKRSSSRVNWILNQLKNVKEPSGVDVKAIWPKRAIPTQAALSKLREEPTILFSENDSLLPQYFEISITRDLAGKFSKPRTFIQEFEDTVSKFYEQVGQHLHNWVSQPPKLKIESDELQKEEDHSSETSEETELGDPKSPHIDMRNHQLTKDKPTESID